MLSLTFAVAVSSNETRGTRTSEGQGMGGSFFNGHFQYCTYRHYHQHCRHTVKQLNTSPKPEYWVRRINAKKSLQTNYSLNKGRFYRRMPLGIWGKRFQQPKVKGSGGEAPSARWFFNFCAKITIFGLS